MSESFFRLLCAAGAALSLSAAACAVDGDAAVSGEEAVQVGSIAPGGFKLYARPQTDPSRSCDVFTSLTIANDGQATLTENVGGPCELFVAPNQRTYALRFETTDCGSTIYKARRVAAGKTTSLTLTDHRTRVCDDIVEAQVIVEESDGQTPTRRLFSHDEPTTQQTSLWLTRAPRQCGSNPWSGAEAKGSRQPSMLEGEPGEVDNFFRAKDVLLADVGFAEPSQPSAVCAACSCPRGDALIVHAKSASDAQRLVSEFGFQPLDGALTRAPTQCGSNPWEVEGGGSAPEASAVAIWAERVGAPVREVGFVQSTEPPLLCYACTCPRGDLAVVFPKDALASSKLQDVYGWAPAK